MVSGVYRDPPEGAVVLSREEKTQRPRPWTGPSRCWAIRSGKTEQRTHDDVRHGTTNLFAWEVKTGKVIGKCFPRRRAEEFLALMKDIARQDEGRELHVVLDTLSTHYTDEIREWPEKNPNITFHFTPTGLPG